MFYWMLASVGLFIGMIAMEALGRRIGKRRLAANPKATIEGLGVVEGSFFALWGLLLAFTFTGAAERIDGRRKLVGDEANAIISAYNYLDLLVDDVRPELKTLMRRYVDARIHLYKQAANASTHQTNLARVEAAQNDIWRSAVQASRTENRNYVASLFLTSITTMFGIAHKRYVAIFIHPLNTVFYLIFIISFICAFFAGLALARHSSYVHLLLFTLINSLFFYIICDMEYPRLGLIRIDDMDRLLIAVRESMR